jgi:hypothetical protein
MTQSEPPSSQSSLFRIGRDADGHWVVQDERGLCGGLFVDRTQALKFALFENGHRPQAVVMVPGVLELDLGRRSQSKHSGLPRAA